MRALTAFSCAVALTLALAPGAGADEHDRLTYMTFSAPVQVPGATLAPGTYTFKLADIESNRHVVQIFTKDDNKLIRTVMTIPNERLDPVKDTFVMFSERPAGTPVALKAWFYPGRSIGEEFMYPRQQAVRIARRVHEAVLTTEGDEATTTGRTVARAGQSTTTSTTTAKADSTTTAKDSKKRVATAIVKEDTTTTAKGAKADTTTTTASTTTSRRNAGAAVVVETPTTTADANQPPTTAARATTVPPAPESQPTTVGTAGQAQAVTAPAPTTAPRRRLPRTASPIALFELISGLSMAAGFGVRQLRKRG